MHALCLCCVGKVKQANNFSATKSLLQGDWIDGWAELWAAKMQCYRDRRTFYFSDQAYHSLLAADLCCQMPPRVKWGEWVVGKGGDDGGGCDEPVLY